MKTRGGGSGAGGADVDRVTIGSHATSDEVPWRYVEPPADGAKRQLLTRGGIAVKGVAFSAGPLYTSFTNPEK